MRELRTKAVYRMTVVHAAVFAGAVAALGVITYRAADTQFRERRDVATGREISDLLARSASRPITELIEEREATRLPGAYGYALFDQFGHRIAGALDIKRPDTGPSSAVFMDPKEGLDHLRIHAADLSDGSRLVVAVDAEPIGQIKSTILMLFGGAFIAVVALGAGGAFLQGRAVHRRLRDISATANAIVAGRTGLRVPVGTRGDEFDAVGLALNTMLDRNERLMEHLRQISSDVAHDLRTPLLRMQALLKSPKADERTHERALEMSDDILKLFSAILRISNVEGGGVARHFVPIDVSELFESLAEGYQGALAESGRYLLWSGTPGIVVNGDRGLLAQSLANLLDNVERHTPTGTHVRVSLQLADDKAVLRVADDGPGVSDEERTQLGQRFFRSAASHKVPGNGLGLSLIVAAVTAHEGEITIGDCAPGLAFEISLPAMVSRSPSSTGMEISPAPNLTQSHGTL